jgi:hypothetical protein
LNKSESSLVVFRMVNDPTLEKKKSRSMEKLVTGLIQQPNGTDKLSSERWLAE